MRLWRTVYYFEAASWLVALLVALGWAVATWWGASTWTWSERIVLIGSAVLFTIICISRPKTYTEKTPWLATSFFVSAVIAMVIVFSRWPTMWFLMAMATGLAVLAIAAAARTKTISEPYSRSELFRLLTAAGSILLGLIVLETLVRLGSGLFDPEIRQLMRANPSNYGVTHPYIGHLHTPKSSFVVSGRDFEATHNLDEIGFRNAWSWHGTQADIVVVGDSVAFGYGVADENAWPAVLARSLPRAPLVNLALVGAGPQQYLRVFETFGTQLRPKLLLVGVWAMNDFTDAAGFETWERSGVGGNDMVWRDFGKPQRVRLSLRHPISSLEAVFRTDLYPWLRRSYLYNLIWALRGGWAGSSALSAIVMPFPDGSRLRMGLPQVASDAARPDRRDFQLLLDALRRLHQIAKDQDAHVLMVLQPGKEEVYLPFVGERGVDLTEQLRHAFDQQGIEYLNLLPEFREAAKAGGKLYRETDGHPNEAGYELISRLVLAHLDRHKAKYGLNY